MMSPETQAACQAALHLIDRYMVAASTRSAAQGGPVRCRGAGCFHCCKEPVQVERMEVEYLLDDLDPVHRECVREKTVVWWEQFHAGEFDQMPGPGGMVGFVHMRRYREENMWCPLLAGGECSVYARRPVSCRTHAAIGHPNKCADDAQRPRQMFLTTDLQGEAEVRALYKFANGASHFLAQFDHLGVWLGHLLLGKTERSQAAHDIMIDFTKPDAFK